jgi:hypothetical protein
MATATQTTALIATFPNRRRAERFVEELHRAGFKNDEIGIMSPGELDRPTETPTDEAAAAGALTGGALGAFAGAVASGLIPGIGPVFAAGLLVGVLGGAAVGATAGGLLGALIGLGIPEEQARKYEAEFQSGRTLVVVQALTRNGEALAILRRLEPER